MFESLIPFIILFLSFSYLGLIDLDRISAKRALLYIMSMVGCCGIIIGIFTGILFLLSSLFYADDDAATSSIIPPINTNSTSLFNISTTDDMYYFDTTQDINGYIDDNGGIDDQTGQQQTWWITDFFYPILAFILCSNTIRS